MNSLHLGKKEKHNIGAVCLVVQKPYFYVGTDSGFVVKCNGEKLGEGMVQTIEFER